MKRFLSLACLAVIVWALFIHEPAAHWRGYPAPADPVQSSHDLPPPFAQGPYIITPLARYEIAAVVLSRDRYRFDESAELAPVDLALGWGPMSIAASINGLSISQSGRWYHYSWWGDPPLDPRAIETHSANTHCLPADKSVRRALLSVSRHDWVKLDGYLVAVTKPDGWHWRSSLTREDTGGGSCEVMWVTNIEHRKL